MEVHGSAGRSVLRLPLLSGSYRTLRDAGTSEVVVERSRFLGSAIPVDDLDQALEFVRRIRAEHHAARHVCYGLRIGHDDRVIDRSNDDGEPARTGGFPLWQLLEGEAITNAVVIVVRYYGGRKLGPGGLARAYRAAGREAIEAAGAVDVWPTETLIVDVSYERVDRVQRAIELDERVTLIDAEYGASVVFTLEVRAACIDEVQAVFAELKGFG